MATPTASKGWQQRKIELFYESVEMSFSADACIFLHVHMIEDQDHFEDGLEVLNELTQVEAEADSFHRNLQQTASLYIHILEHIKKITL